MKSRVLFVAVFLAVCLVVPRTALAQEPAVVLRPDAPMPSDPNVTVGTLDNGLRYYIRANHRPEQRAEVRLVVNAGSVLEDEDQQGLAHFVEHMAFNGTAHFPKQALIDYMERIGMRFGPEVNAFTSFDETVYMLTIPTDTAEIVENAFQILEDWAYAVLFDPAEVNKERGVVIEEWRLGQGAQARMRDKQFPILFRGSRYAERLPIGQLETLETFDHASLERFYRDWYRPDLMAVIAVGDFDPAVIEGLIRSHFARIPAREAPRERTVFDVPDHEETLFAVATDEEATQTQVSVYFKQPPRQQETAGAYRQALVEMLYNQMLNQRLFELTQTPDAPFVVAFSGQGSFVRSKEVYTLGALVRDGGVLQGLEAVLTEGERVAQHGFTASELDRAKREFLRGMEQAFAERDRTNSAMYAGEYMRNFLEHEPFPGIAYELAFARQALPTIALAEINRLARAWITDRNRVVLVNAPEKPGVEVPSETVMAEAFDAVVATEILAYEESLSDAPLLPVTPERAPVVSEREIPEVGLTIWELANGVRVLLKPTDFKADEILFRAWSPGGTSLASDEDFVSAIMATNAVGVGGVGEFSLIDLQKVLADKVASARPYVSSLYEGVTGNASPQDLETLFQLIYLTVTAPREDSSAFEAFRTRMEALLENRSASPESAFQDTLSLTLAQYHPREPLFTRELVVKTDLDQSIKFYRDRFADASDFSFVFVGNFTLETIRPFVETYLGGLPSIGRVEQWRDEGIDPPTGVIRKEVHKGTEPKSETAIIFTGTFDDTRINRYAMRALQEVLDIRLRERLREDLGGTYGVSVGANSSRYPDGEYSVSVSFGAAPDRVEELAGVVFQQIDSLRIAGPSAEDIEKVREMQRRERETNLKENGYWLSQLVAYDQMDGDFRDILTYETLIDALTPSLVRDAALRYLRPDNYVRVTLLPETHN
jgi:zinc protease